MKYLLIALTLFTANSAKAEVITCHQTEPFVTETYNVEKGTLVISDDVMNTSRKLINLKLVILANGGFEIRNSAGKAIRVLTLDNQGSDGMSDIVYPFTGTDAKGNRDGCESTELKAKRE